MGRSAPTGHSLSSAAGRLGHEQYLRSAKVGFDCGQYRAYGGDWAGSNRAAGRHAAGEWLQYTASDQLFVLTGDDSVRSRRWSMHSKGR